MSHAEPHSGRRRPLVPRSPHEPHRVATPLELFFDLVFVVAVAQASAQLHHAVAEAHPVEGLEGFLLVFFAIWWAWVNFTWYASAYDNDDAAHRVAAFVQMGGALLLAAGVPGLFEERGPTPAVVLGYVVMRVVSVVQWLRVSAADGERRTTALRYAYGTALVQTAWVASLLLPTVPVGALLALIAADLAVPAWAERAAMTPWHPHHIGERHGLFTIIVLGESVLAGNIAIQGALSSGQAMASLAPIAIGGLLTVCSMWWMYFDRSSHDLLTSFRRAFLWGYGHYFIFGSAADVGAGMAVNVDVATAHAKVGSVGAGMAVAIPVAVYLLSLWTLHRRPEYQHTRLVGPIAAGLVLLAPFAGQAVPVIGAILASAIAIKELIRRV
jgi:low temperature requirement protein LtrA